MAHLLFQRKMVKRPHHVVMPSQMRPVRERLSVVPLKHEDDRMHSFQRLDAVAYAADECFHCLVGRRRLHSGENKLIKFVFFFFWGTFLENLLANQRNS